MKSMATDDLIYKGGWQRANTILQKLAGPIGDGEVWYPNGDHFKGGFHLSFASVNGPAYAADGRYDFADGSYIENAWIHTLKDKKPQYWGLHGVFRIHHPQGPDSIAMFCSGGKHYGFELYLDEKKPLRPDQPLRLYTEIEGDEHSDGCVYDGDDYSLELTWKN